MALAATGFQADRHNLLTVAPANPAAGAILTWACPTNRVVQIVGVGIQLVTNAGGANRLLSVVIDNGAGLDAPYSPASAVQAGGLTRVYRWTTGIGPGDFSADTGPVVAPLGCCYQLKPGESLQVNILNVNAADQLSAAVIRYFEWTEH